MKENKGNLKNVFKIVRKLRKFYGEEISKRGFYTAKVDMNFPYNLLNQHQVHVIRD